MCKQEEKENKSTNSINYEIIGSYASKLTILSCDTNKNTTDLRERRTHFCER